MRNDERIPNLALKLKSNTFDPLFGKELSEMGKIPDFAYFRQFFGQKVGQMFFDLHFEARFGIFSSFRMY